MHASFLRSTAMRTPFRRWPEMGHTGTDASFLRSWKTSLPPERGDQRSIRLRRRAHGRMHTSVASERQRTGRLHDALLVALGVVGVLAPVREPLHHLDEFLRPTSDATNYSNDKEGFDGRLGRASVAESRSGPLARAALRRCRRWKARENLPFRCVRRRSCVDLERPWERQELHILLNWCCVY